MAQAFLPLAVAGTALSAFGQLEAGKQQERGAFYEAAQMERAAGQRQATSQRAALEVERQGKLQASRALAVAAAGGGASDPTVVNLLADLAADTNYRRMVALYEGEEEAQGLREEAKMTRIAGREARRASQIGAFGTALSGAGSMFARFGRPS